MLRNTTRSGSGPEPGERPGLGHLAPDRPARLGRVVGHHDPRGAAPAGEDLGEAGARALGTLGPQGGALPVVGVGQRRDEGLGVEGLPGDDGPEVAEVGPAGPRRPLELETALAGAGRAGEPSVTHEAPRRRVGPPWPRSETSLSKTRLAVWRRLRGAARSASSTEPAHASWPASAGLSRGAGTGAEGDRSSMPAYFATVFLLARGLRAISALGTRRRPSTACHPWRPGAGSSPPSFPGALAKVSARASLKAGAARLVPRVAAP